MTHLTDKKHAPIINGMTTMKQLLTITILFFTATICTSVDAYFNLGACCYTDDCNTFGCVETTSVDCLNMGGSYNNGAVCANIDCSDPANQDYGACCYEDADGGAMCIFTDEPECLNNFMGVWHQGMPCDCVSCDTNDPWGACCYLKNCEYWVCEEMYQSDCYNMFDGTHWANKMCKEITCPSSDLGACCVEDIDGGMICYYIKENDCATYGGIWYEGLPCKCEPCLPTGVCCYIDNCESHCGEMTEQQCYTFFGSTYFPNDTCDTVACPPQDETFGACCYNDPDLGMMCIETDMYNCDALLGIFYGGTPCECAPECVVEPEPCEVLPSPNCVGPPQYTDPDYLAFGGGDIAVQTASPVIRAGSNQPNGTVLMIFDLTGPFTDDVPASLLRYSHPTWTGDQGNDLGSILGLALDNDGNIYVTTTKTWDGTDPVGFGGWGAVYKIDTNTALASVFATIPMINNESGLGSITYDCDHQQFFVSSFEDGLIYRLNMSGTILDTFDHIGTHGQQSGYAGPAVFGDRPWAVEVHGNRLYYSLWNENKHDTNAMSNEIWSVPLNAAYAPVANAEVLEITMQSPLGHDWTSPVSDIDFSDQGTMFTSERTQTSFTNIFAHGAFLKEYECTTSEWTLTSNNFHVGTANIGNGGNSAGGVDATSSRIWVSADNMHEHIPGDMIYGIQGLPTTGGDPTTSVLIDYQDYYGVNDKGMLGDLVVSDGGGNGDQTGACCYLDICDWVCQTTTWTDCNTVYGGTFHLNKPCEDIDCPELDFGSCCFYEGGIMYCMEIPLLNCNELNGTWHQGVPCNCDPCPTSDPTGACCFLDVDSGYMICVEMTQVECENKPESSYAGDYTICDDDYCCKPIGACCVNGQCLLVSIEQCEAASGLYYGDGAVCDTIECEYCPWDLDNDGDVDVADLLILIAAWGICPQYLIFISTSSSLNPLIGTAFFCLVLIPSISVLRLLQRRLQQ